MTDAARDTTAKQRHTRVVIADDHAIVRQGLRDLISHEPDLDVCAEAATPAEALDAIARFEPEVVLLDLMFDGVSVFELLRQITSSFPNVRILVLSMHDELYYAERCLRAGAKGFIMKQQAPDQIVRAIREVAEGRIHLSDQMSGKLLNVYLDGRPDAERTGIETLTDRELQVFELIGKGMTTRGIGDVPHLSIKTVETHRLNVMSKLAVSNANELIRTAAVHWVEHGRENP